MKKHGIVLLMIILLISAGSSFQQASAQEKAKTEKEKEEEILKAIDEQKKAMTEAKKAQKEAEFELKKITEEQQDAMKDIQISIESAGDRESAVRVYNSRRPGRTSSTGEPFIFTPGVENWYGFAHGGDGERTTWDFSKSVKENTFSREYTFDVEKTVNTVVMAINGDCKAGDIRIKIIMPNGKTYSDTVIDEFGNLSLRKSFTISDTENQDKAGEWKFLISSNKATGFFKISLQTY